MTGLEGVDSHGYRPPHGSLDDVAEARRPGLDSRSGAVLARLLPGRRGEPADLAGAVVFLASPSSDDVHDIVLPVDGGRLAR